MRHPGIEAATQTGAECRVAVLRWEISPHAIRSSPLPEIAAMNGQAERIARAVLDWRVEAAEAQATLRLEIGEDDLVVDLGSSTGVWVQDGEFSHGDYGGLLRLTVRDGRVVWARTEVLQRVLGLGGGVYDGPDAA